jgi:transposase
MNIDLAALPDDVETLQRMVRTLATERASLTEAQAEIERLRLIVQKLQRSQFGRRAERLDDDQLQLGFEDVNTDIARVEASLPSATVKTPRSRPDQACRRICPARTSGSISSITPAPATAANCI